MRWIVNVENLNFEELIPLLKKNNYIKEAIGYDKEQEKLVFKQLEFLFKKLKSGKIAEHFLLGAGLCQCLDELERVLITSEYVYDHDWDILPITKEKLKNFLNII